MGMPGGGMGMGGPAGGMMHGGMMGGMNPGGMAPLRPPSAPGARLFVSNLSFGTTWQQLKDRFKTLGNVTYCTIFKVRRAMLVEQQVLALSQLTAFPSWRACLVEQALSVHPLGPWHTRIGDVHACICTLTLARLSMSSGLPGKCIQLQDKATGQSKGSGIVEFDNPMNAQRAINELSDSVCAKGSAYGPCCRGASAGEVKQIDLRCRKPLLCEEAKLCGKGFAAFCAIAHPCLACMIKAWMPFSPLPLCAAGRQSFHWITPASASRADAVHFFIAVEWPLSIVR
eukprot:scaffold68791_cov18-Tisochrysis_lutea.AAC.1